MTDLKYSEAFRLHLRAGPEFNFDYPKSLMDTVEDGEAEPKSDNKNVKFIVLFQDFHLTVSHAHRSLAVNIFLLVSL